MRSLQAIVTIAVLLLVAGCDKEDTGESKLPKPMSEAEIQKLTPEQQANVRRFQEMQRQNSDGNLR